MFFRGGEVNKITEMRDHAWGLRTHMCMRQYRVTFVISRLSTIVFWRCIDGRKTGKNPFVPRHTAHWRKPTNCNCATCVISRSLKRTLSGVTYECKSVQYDDYDKLFTQVGQLRLIFHCSQQKQNTAFLIYH